MEKNKKKILFIIIGILIAIAILIAGVFVLTNNEEVPKDNDEVIEKDKEEITAEDLELHYKLGSDKPLVITINGDMTNFSDLYISDELVDAKNYKVDKEAKTITFTESFANSLKAGEITIEATTTLGKTIAVVTITIEEAESETTDNDTTSSNVGSGNAGSGSTGSGNGNAGSGNGNTGGGTVILPVEGWGDKEACRKAGCASDGYVFGSEDEAIAAVEAMHRELFQKYADYETTIKPTNYGWGSCIHGSFSAHINMSDGTMIHITK